MKVSLLLLSFLLTCASQGYGQQPDLRKEQQIEELAESLTTNEEASSEGSLLLEDVSYYADHPVSINSATEEELLRLNFINFRQVRSIIAYREKYGQILTLKELSILNEFDEKLLQKMEPFFIFDQERDSVQKRKDLLFHQTFLTRIKGSFPASSGYSTLKGKPPAYTGNPFGCFARYRGELGKWLEMGFTAENDAGEEFFRKSNKQGFDFMSGFVCWNGKGIIRKVVAGDYHLRFGQGVNLWSGGGVSYASDLSSLMRTGENIRPYSSSDENSFFRGGALQLGFKSVKLSFFYSNKRKDANLEQDSLGGNFISSFRMDGFHRTTSELADEKNVGDSMLGGYGDFRFNKWRFGLLASFQRFGLPVTNGDALYKSKTFEGVANFNLGFDYHLIFNQISFFGECGVSENWKMALVNGMVWKAHPQLSLSLLYRNYNPAFQSFYAGAYSAGSGGRNEEGLFAAFEFFPVSKIKISGQADLFYFPWMTYQTISPAKGQTLSFQSEVAIRPNLTVYLQARFANKPQKLAGISGVPEQLELATSKWRLHGEWKICDRIQLRSRLEYTGYRYNQTKEKGALIFQDFICTVSTQLKAWIRIAYYHTDGYNSRVYSYENDLLYYFAIPEFHGEGVRSYLNLKWQPCRAITCYFKGGYTLRAGAESMGSGNDTTQGNHRMDIRGQLCFKF